MTPLSDDEILQEFKNFDEDKYSLILSTVNKEN